MSQTEREHLIIELRHLTRTNILRQDEEAQEARRRVKEICQELGGEFPEDLEN